MGTNPTAALALPRRLKAVKFKVLSRRLAMPRTSLHLRSLAKKTSARNWTSFGMLKTLLINKKRNMKN